MPLVLRWRRWIRSGGGHGSIPGVSYLSGNITPGYSFAQSPLKGPRRQERIDSQPDGRLLLVEFKHNQQLVPVLRFLERFDGYETPSGATVPSLFESQLSSLFYTI